MKKPLRLSIWIGPGRNWEDTVCRAKLIEAAGWDGIWVADHLMSVPPARRDEPQAEALSTLGALCAITDSVTIGSLACPASTRHPSQLVSMAANCADISGGRFVLGIGAGWQTTEHDAHGFYLGSRSERSDRLEECAHVVRSLLCNRTTTFRGRFYVLDQARSEPTPNPPVPLLIAGKGERRTLRTAARFANIWNGWVTAEQLVEKSAILASHCDALGRDDQEISRSTQVFVVPDRSLIRVEETVSRFGSRVVLTGPMNKLVEEIADYRHAGLDELIIPDWNFSDTEEFVDIQYRLLDALRDVA